MKTSNKKLKEKMDRICNADPRKKLKSLRKRGAKISSRAEEKEEIRLANEKKQSL